MFSETAGSRKTIGDVDVLYHDGLYHLFHLVLPNHDFIAHAVSTNGFNWRRVNNALFIGDPGSWDDLMLWTMHVSPNPFRPGQWRMFYTGLSRRDQGQFQRIGLAVSDDLFHWRKVAVSWTDRRGGGDPPAVKQARAISATRDADALHAPYQADSAFPLEPDPRHYEASLDEGRQLISFRDPYYVHDEGEGWLLAAGRVNQGPIVRRGCVSLLKETSESHFESRPALHHPMLYDDIEVPNFFRVDGECYLIGSIREDAKIRYWYTDKIGNPWRSYYDNVLMARGNYAARICQDDKGYLLWNFYSADPDDPTNRNVNNLMPPPKRIVRAENGMLRVKSFEGFEDWVESEINTRCIHQLKQGLGEQFCHIKDGTLELDSEAGFQAFVFDDPVECFRFSAKLQLRGQGKCGLVFRIDEHSHDGYYVSLDLIKGVAQIRAWGTGEAGSGEYMMQFRALQSAYWFSETPGAAEVQLTAFGSYLELTVDNRVLLSLADQTFSRGLMGVYVETAKLEVSQSHLQRMRHPSQTDSHLVTG